MMDPLLHAAVQAQLGCFQRFFSFFKPHSCRPLYVIVSDTSREQEGNQEASLPAVAVMWYGSIPTKAFECPVAERDSPLPPVLLKPRFFPELPVPGIPAWKQGVNLNA